MMACPHGIRVKDCGPCQREYDNSKYRVHALKKRAAARRYYHAKKHDADFQEKRRATRKLHKLRKSGRAPSKQLRQVRKTYVEPESVRLAKNDWTRRNALSLRSAALAALGGRCEECGYSDERALCVDHRVPIRRNSSGNWEGGVSSYYAVTRSRNPLEKYALLCANCNVIKARENGEFSKRFWKQTPEAPDDGTSQESLFDVAAQKSRKGGST
jgi:5-methylcytosine-specific restriction endonuclease McrA